MLRAFMQWTCSTPSDSLKSLTDALWACGETATMLALFCLALTVLWCAGSIVLVYLLS